jgi:predicted carbohydrate-binding protein with CBM5 and CBM33 domain
MRLLIRLTLTAAAMGYGLNDDLALRTQKALAEIQSAGEQTGPVQSESQSQKEPSRAGFPEDTPALPQVQHVESRVESAEQGEWFYKADWWVAICTFLLFVATSGLWLFTGLLWRETRRAVVGGEEAAKAAIQAADAANRHVEEAARTASAMEKAAFAMTSAADGQLASAQTANRLYNLQQEQFVEYVQSST